MNLSSVPFTPDVSAESTSRWQRIGPIVTLLLLAPAISEVLYGATRLSVIFVLIPEILTWGCAALLIREWVHRWHKGWKSMLLLGIALAVAEEWIIQQTSIAPLVGLAKQAYGRVWGVNWVYFLWAVGYESVWVVLIPIQLTELLFPQRRHKPWLRTRGLIIASIVFLIGSFMAWYGWTQRARVHVFHMPPYSPPVAYIVGAFVAIVLLVLAARAWPTHQPTSGTGVPSPAGVGAMTTVLGTPWTAFVLLGYGSYPQIPFSLALVGGIAWCIVTFLLIRRWTSTRNWNDTHRFAVVFGGVMACILGGFVVFKVGGALRIDWIGKMVFDALAILWLVWLSRETPQQPAPQK